MRRKFIATWIAVLGLSAAGSAAGAPAGGLGNSVCVNLGMLIALTITPVDTLVSTFNSFLPNNNTE